MTNTILNLDQLIEVLQSAVRGEPGAQFLVLDGDLFPAAGTLVDFLKLPDGQLRIDQMTGQDLVQPDRAQNLVKVVGSAGLFQPNPPATIQYNIEITGRVPQADVVHLDLKGTPADAISWKFADNFVKLPDFLGSKEGEAGLVWQPSFFDDIGISSPTVTIANYDSGPDPEGLTLTAKLDPTAGTLGQHIGKYLTGTLDLSGSITMRGGKFPLLNLVAATEIKVEPLVNVGLALLTGDGSGTEEDPAFSTADLVGRVTIESFPEFTISGPVLQGDDTWVLNIAIADPQRYSLANGLGALTKFVGGNDLTLPQGIYAFASMYLDSVTVGITPASGAATTINLLGASIKYEHAWPLPLPGVSITDISIIWEIANPGSKPLLVGSIAGKLVIGDSAASAGDDLIALAIEVDISGLTGPSATSVTIEAVLDQPPTHPASIDRIVEHFAGFNPELGVDVTGMDLQIDTGARTLLFYASIGTDLPIIVPLIKVTGASFAVHYAPNQLVGSVALGMSFGSLPLAATADYRGKDAGWLLKGGVWPSTTLPTLGEWLIDVDRDRFSGIPTTIGAIQLRGLLVSYDTKLKQFNFDTTVGWRYTLASLDTLDSTDSLVTLDTSDSLTWDIEAEFVFQATSKEPKNEYSGSLRGTIQVNSLAVSLIYAFDVQNNKTITFQIAYQSKSLTAVLKQNKEEESILTVNLGGVTFGGILEFLVNLVDPNLEFKLSAPWDVLNQIDFSNLKLTINLTTKDIGINYTLNKNLGIVDIKIIGLELVNKAGRRTVDIQIEGRFFDQTYTEQEPLKWDLLNDPPPTPPGKGTQFLDLRYLGFGQNVGFRNTQDFKTVQDVIESLTEEFQPASSEDQNPLLDLPNLKFTGDGRWLVGADFTLMEFLTIQGVFADPDLYGLRIALAGEKAKSFAGLDFEILYRKITDKIGVYHIALKLPDAMRQLDFGSVSVTLPIIKVDIYTNGNFRIDLGFPENRNFSVSFAIQAFPFIGKGGLYFALLDGNTSEKVPRITNGTFAPVIEFGLGLSLGLGKEINKGVLKAGLSVLVEGIVEGALAWFNPNNNGSSTDLFYLIEGAASLVGKMYGSVDFVVIKAEVSVEAFATLILTIEAYEAILIQIELGVSVSASVKILFIRIHFSFRMTLNLAFTVGSSQPTPWIKRISGGGTSSDEPFMLRQQCGVYPHRKLTTSQLFQRLMQLANEQADFDWSPVPVFGEIQTIPLSIIPTLTIATPETLLAFEGATSPATEPAVQVVMPLFVKNSIPATARSATEVLNVEMEEPRTAPFNLLIEGMLLWAKKALRHKPNSPVFSQIQADKFRLVDLLAIEADLDSRDKSELFTYDQLIAFVEQNFRLLVGTPLKGPTSPVDAMLAGDELQESATVFPIVPELAMVPPGGNKVEFWNHSCASQAYQDYLDTYFNELRVDYLTDVANDPLANTSANAPSGIESSVNGTNGGGPFRQSAAPTGCPEGEESLATIIFRDYFAMIMKGSVQAALEMLKAYTYEATGQESLTSLLQSFGSVAVNYRVALGESPLSICAQFGMPLELLLQSNPWLEQMDADAPLLPGTELLVETALTVLTLATANADYPLHYVPGKEVRMPISGVKHQVQSDDTLVKIQTAFGLPNVTSLFDFIDPNLNQNPNAINADLLLVGSTLTIPEFTFTPTQQNATRDVIAARYFLRNQPNFFLQNQPNLNPRFAQWYTQWILDHLQNGFAPGEIIEVPVAHLVDGAIKQTGTDTYELVQGDTPEDVGCIFALIQLYPNNNKFLEFLDKVSLSAPYCIPAQPHPVNAGESFSSIAALFAINPGDMTAAKIAEQNIDTIPLLAPQAVVSLPTLNYPIGKDETLASVASQLDLTLDELAVSVKDQVGIFQPYDKNTNDRQMTIPDVAEIDVSQLFEDMARFGKFNSVSSMVSRFLMHGLRVPKTNETIPPPPGEQPKLWGLYEVVGQQFPMPAGSTGVYNINFTKGTTGQWLCFQPQPSQARSLSSWHSADPVAGVTCHDSLDMKVSAEFFLQNMPSTVLEPEFVSGPTAMPLFNLLPPRYSLPKSVHWQSAVELSLPGPTATPTGPSGTVKTQAGQPSIWPFPETLNREVERVLGSTSVGPTQGTQPYHLISAPKDRISHAKDQVMERYSWATAIPLRVRQVPSESSDGALKTGYLISGADQQGRDLLLKAWKYLDNAGQSPKDKIYLLYRPSATSNNSSGMASAKLNQDLTFVLKTNLSTVTHSNSSAQADLLGIPPGEFFSHISSPKDFLKLLWEASITGTGGFYLNYVASGSATGLPQTLFANDEETTLWLVFLLDSQSRATSPDRSLYPFNNCAVVVENLDASAAGIFAELVDPTPHQKSPVSNVPAGVVGFCAQRRDPSPAMSGPVSPTDMTRSLYGLMGYQVTGNPDFDISNEGLPIGPADNDKTSTRGAKASDEPCCPGATGTKDGIWTFQHNVPVAKFGKVNNTPATPIKPPIGPTGNILPDPANNPYRGITGIVGRTGASRPLSAANLRFRFHDVFGNQTESTGWTKAISCPVGYTDDLISLTSWPSSASNYLFSPGQEGHVGLQTEVSLENTNYVCGNSLNYEKAVTTAASDSERYKQIFYQVQQHDVEFRLQTNLGVVTIAPDDVKASLTAFVTKAKVFSDICSSLIQRKSDPVLDNTLFGNLASTYAVTPTKLAETNQSTPIKDIFEGEIKQPLIVSAPPMNTLAKLAKAHLLLVPRTEGESTVPDPLRVIGMRVLTAAEKAAWQPTPPTSHGMPNTSMTAGQVAANNVNLPLTPGISIKTNTQTTTLDSFKNKAENTLAAVAAKLHCVVTGQIANPDSNGLPIHIGLFVDNFDVADIVADHLVIELFGIKITTSLTTTFSDLYETFKVQPDTTIPRSQGEVAAALSSIEGLFRAPVTLKHASYLIPQPSSTGQPGPVQPTFALASLPPAASTAEEIGNLNGATQNFFYTGSPVFISEASYTPQESDTFQVLSAVWKLPISAIANHNLGTTLKTGTELKIPTLTQLPTLDSGSLQAAVAAYVPKSDDSLDAIASRFPAPTTDPPVNSAVQTMAEFNRYLPGVFANGATITIDEKTVKTKPLDSLESVFQQFREWIGNFTNFIDQIKSTTGLLNPNGVYLTFSPHMPAAEPGGKTSPTLSAIAAQFNITATQSSNHANQVLSQLPSVVSLLQANRSLEKFLKQGIDIYARSQSEQEPNPPSLKVGAYDTVESILRRFQDELHLTVNVEDLAAANDKVGICTVGERFLLPASPTLVNSEIKPVIPPAQAHEADDFGAVPGESDFVFPIIVSFEQTRAKGLVNPGFVDATAVYKVSSTVVARTSSDASAQDHLSLQGFAGHFEAAFAKFRLKAATSTRKSLGNGDTQAHEVFAINFGPKGVSQLEVMANKPEFYALRPLSNELITRGATFRPYRSGCGLCQPRHKKFESVDLDNWMQQFLTTVDLALTESYAINAFTQPTGQTGPARSVRQELPEGSTATSQLDGPVGLVGLVEPAAGNAWWQSSATGCSGCSGPSPNAPLDYDRLVKAKQKIAQGLAPDVSRILDQAGATAGYPLNAAQDALYQEMLINLSEAYRVNSVVQYPVGVSGPFITPPVGTTGRPFPPRVSGKMALNLYSIPSAHENRQDAIAVNSLAYAADQYFNVATAYLAATVLNVRGLLKSGATVDYSAAEYHLKDQDTLADVAKFFEINTDLSEPVNWKPWTEFVCAIQQQPILDHRASFSVTRIQRLVDQQDTFSTIAEFFGIGSGALAEANQLQGKIFNSGVLIYIKDYSSYTTTGAETETIWSVVETINETSNAPPQELTISGFAAAVEFQAGLLRAGNTLYEARLLPNLSL